MFLGPVREKQNSVRKTTRNDTTSSDGRRVCWRCVRACVGGGGDGVVKMIELKMLERMKMFGWCV